MTQISNLGPVNQLANAADGVWTGSISATQAEANVLVNVEEATGHTLNDYFVDAASAAPTRCIDGRPSAGYDAASSRALGPQLAGGTPVTAVLRRIVMSDAGIVDATLAEDLPEVIAMLTTGGLGAGGHIDDHHTPDDEDTGCGAVDKLPVILGRIADPQAWKTIRQLAAALLGGAFDGDAADVLQAKVVAFQTDAYLGKAGEHYAYKQKAVHELRAGADADPVEELAGAHLEKGLVVNTIDGSTFDRDRYDADNGNAMQLFDYDVWFVQWIAATLFPGDDQTATNARNHFTVLHVIYSIATAMVLTDGSQALLVRK